MTKEKLSELAAELGLERAYEMNPDAFAAALEKTRALAARIPGAKSFADEPAHVFNVPFDANARPSDDGAGR